MAGNKIVEFVVRVTAPDKTPVATLRRVLCKLIEVGQADAAESVSREEGYDDDAEVAVKLEIKVMARRKPPGPCQR